MNGRTKKKQTKNGKKQAICVKKENEANLVMLVSYAAEKRTFGKI